MAFYVKEYGWYYEKLHGPFQTIAEAEANRPTDKVFGRPEAQIRYDIIEQTNDGSTKQLLNE